MASRTGTRAQGTDGSDFKSRERVAPHYNQGPVIKKRMKFLFHMHCLVWLLVFMKILPEILLRFGYKTRLFFNRWPFPRSELWEFMWVLGTVPAVIFGNLSLNKNRLTLMRITLCGILAFGVLPVVWGIIEYAPVLYDYYYSRNYKFNIGGFPIIVMQYIFFSLAMQIHGFTLYFGLKLTGMWSSSVAIKKQR